MNNFITTQYTSLSAKVVGILFILSALLDFITLAIPVKIFESQWQVEFTNNVVDRGIVPLIGILFLLLGFWLDSTISKEQPVKKKKKKSLNWKVLVYILASLLGVAYLLLVPIHITNINELKRITLVRINQQAEQTETQLRGQYEQLQQLLADPEAGQKLEAGIEQIDNVLGSGRQLSAEQRVQLEQNKQRLQTYQGYLEQPELLDAQLERLQTELDENRIERTTQANLEAFKRSFRIGANSLLLAISYSIIGWFGLRNVIKAGAKKSPSVQ